MEGAANISSDDRPLAPGAQVVPGATSEQRYEISHQIEPHLLTDRIRGKLLFLLAWPTLIVAMRRRSRRTELWIGDSHAMTVNREVTNSSFMRAPEGQLILRAGARLMYSFARKGFPSRVLRVGRFVNRFGRAGALVPIFCTGEIDVRVHLPKHLDASMDWVEAYVARCMELAGLFKPDKVGFFVPTPPVDVPEEDVWFPITGTISERVEAHRKLRHALAAAVGQIPEAVLLDLTDLLAGAGGGMPLESTSDGAHTNRATVARIRARIADYRLLAD